jgi:hypothetical protein
VADKEGSMGFVRVVLVAIVLANATAALSPALANREGPLRVR